MFSDLKNDSASKLVEVREFLDLTNSLIPAPPIPTPNSVLSSKGFFYVHIYGVFEYTVTTAVEKTISLINDDNVLLNDLKPLVLSMVLNSECDSITSTRSRNWKKRWSLFEKIRDNGISQIATEIFPTDGKNIRYSQLESIWTTFCIDDPILNIPSIGGRIKDIVDNRNAIAHGNFTPSEIGSRVSMPELYNRYNEMSNYCSYLIQVFEDYITNKDYLK
jgi:hypothetical protein